MAPWKTPFKGRYASPFYHPRTYGGFSDAQIAFVETMLGSLEGRSVLDPMCGQAQFLSQMSWKGVSVSLGDLNPALLLLACLRDPILLGQADTLAALVAGQIRRVTGRLKPHRYTFVETWIPESIQEQLREYVHVVGLDRFGSSVFTNRRFWEGPPELRLAAALPVLAARRLAVFTRSGNVTWLKKGGLQREDDVRGALLDALDGWVRYAHACLSQDDWRPSGHSSVYLAPMDSEHGSFGGAARPSAIITSPPYANRLDYTRLWAPELEVVSAMCEGVDSVEIKSEMVGSNVVRGKSLQESEIAALPAAILSALQEIRDGNAGRLNDASTRAARDYYYPFFANYAVALSRVIRNLMDLVQPEGHVVIFIRDTVAGGVLLPIGQLVMDTARSIREVDCLKDERILIHSHVGQQRRNRRPGLYGHSQQEWLLLFRKGGQ